VYYPYIVAVQDEEAWREGGEEKKLEDEEAWRELIWICFMKKHQAHETRLAHLAAN